MDRKTLKEIEKRISADVYLEIRKADKDILSQGQRSLSENIQYMNLKSEEQRKNR